MIPGLRSVTGSASAIACPGANARLLRAACLDSYARLLASVPERTRSSFRARMLGPLEEYDSTRQADLVHTLEVFLSCSGS